MAAMHRRGKVIALSTVAVGVVVLIATGFAAKDRIREEWYLWKLTSARPEVRATAALSLGRMRSVRAVPLLVRQLVIGGNPIGGGSPEWLVYEEVEWALKEIGPTSVPWLIEQLKIEDDFIVVGALLALRELGGKARAAIPALEMFEPSSNLESRIEEGDSTRVRIRRLAEATLRRIRGVEDPGEEE